MQKTVLMDIGHHPLFQLIEVNLLKPLSKQAPIYKVFLSLKFTKPIDEEFNIF